MDTYIEIGYIQRLGASLKNFKQVKPQVWSFSHSCEDDKHKLKTRCNIFFHKGTAFVKCFHCNYAASFKSFIKETNGSLADEYRMEDYKHTQETRQDIIVPVQQESIELIDANLDGLIPVNKLPKSSSILKFLSSRKIPEHTYKLLYVAKHFYPWASFYKPEFKKIQDDSPRLVLPYFDIHGRVIGFTARTFSPKVEPRYIHLRIDKNVEFIYGTERVDPSRTIYVCEGQVDSLFCNNAIAVGGASYSSDFVMGIRTNCVLIPDQDWKRNKQVGDQVKKAILNGFKVCLLPDNVKGKDLNDFVKNGLSLDELKKLIDTHVYSGLEAQLEFALLKKY